MSYTPNTQLQSTQIYNTPQVAHLAWCLSSPSLVSLKPDDHFTRFLTLSQKQNPLWLKQLGQQPAPLLDYLNAHHHRLLGSYFECLWQFYFTQHPDWQLLEHHVQVFDTTHKQTLGELDLLVLHHPSQQYFHIELAAKFYLRHPQLTGLNNEHWLGPQANDRLDLKIDKLHKKQLPFLHHSATQAALVNRGLNNPYEQALVMKGYLFHHWQDIKEIAKSAHQATATGFWLHEKSAASLFSDNLEQHWAILPKHNWLGTFNSIHDSELVSDTLTTQKTVAEHFANSVYKHALMLVMLKQHRDGFTESQRFMLVHNQWPNKPEETKK